jgi:ketosteroid isomerase-like protein
VSPAEQLDLARRSYAAFSPPDLDALLPLYDPECEWRLGWMTGTSGTDTHRGHDGLRTFVKELEEASVEHVTEIDEARVTTDGRLLLEFTNRVRTSGAAKMELVLKGWQEGEFRDGRILTVIMLEKPPAEWDHATPIC